MLLSASATTGFCVLDKHASWSSLSDHSCTKHIIVVRSLLAVLMVLCWQPPLPVLLPAATGQGLQISGRVERKDGQVVYHVVLENGTQTPLDGFMMQLNKSTFGLAAAPGPLPIRHQYCKMRGGQCNARHCYWWSLQGASLC